MRVSQHSTGPASDLPVTHRLMRRPQLLLAGFALVLFAGSLLGRGRLELEPPVAIEGAFERGNATVVPPTAAPLPPTFWSSWAARGANVGSIALGPFPGPRRIEILLAGYPRAAGNRILLENTTTGAVVKQKLTDPGEVWHKVQLSLPISWRNDPVLLRAVDGSAEPAGWIAISQPRSIPGWAVWWDGILPRAAVMLMVGFATILLLSAAALLFRGSPLFTGPGQGMAAAAVVSATAYATLWAYFFSHRVGAVLVPAILVGAVVICILRRRDAGALWGDPDWRVPCFMALAVAAFLTGMLFSFSVSKPTYTIASQRWADGFPPDNILPSELAERLAEGLPLKPFWGDWLSSDRPPLQAAWILLLAPVAAAMGEHWKDAAQYAGIWFQLLWIPAVWQLVRTLGLRPRASVLVVAAPLLSGFFLVNSTFVWPKLGGAALVLAAFLNWFRPSPDADSGWGRFILGGTQAGLGFLAHGSVAFALVPIGFLAVWGLRSHARRWLVAVTVIIFLVAPWVAYQKYSDPPGDRLLKMHLGGIAAPDSRPALQAIEESYAAVSGKWILRTRAVNFRNLFSGEWSDLAMFRLEDPRYMRANDFFFTFFALGWWNLGFLVLAASALPLVRKRVGGGLLRDSRLLLGWAGFTLAFWVAVMFAPGSTVIHQGSYTVQLVLFTTLAVILWKLHPLAFAVVVLAQAAAFPRLWLSPTVSFVGESLRLDSLWVIGLGIAMVVLIAVSSEPRTAGRNVAVSALGADR